MDNEPKVGVIGTKSIVLIGKESDITKSTILLSNENQVFIIEETPPVMEVELKLPDPIEYEDSFKEMLRIGKDKRRKAQQRTKRTFWD